MGLDITLYIGVKSHRCDYISNRGVCYKRGEYYIPDTNDAISPHEWIERTYSQSCNCDDIKCIGTGYVSALGDGYCPGYKFSYDESDGFYFGSYMKFYRVSEKIDVFKNMSDCDGWYAGSFLRHLHGNLKKYIESTDDVDDVIEQYFDLLNDNYDVLDNCVLQHG